MLVHVATSVLTQAYSNSSTSPSPLAIADAFYRDLRLTVFNCFAYNTELTSVYGQAQKLYQAIWRHCRLWLFGEPLLPHNNYDQDTASSSSSASSSSASSSSSSGRLSSKLPPLRLCSDQYCLLSGQPIDTTHQKFMKCGRCFGSFLLEAIDDAAAAAAGAGGNTTSTTTSGGTGLDLTMLYPFVIFPSKEVLDNVHFDEWYCPFCLAEDSSRGMGLTASASASATAGGSVSGSVIASGSGTDNHLGEPVFPLSPFLPSASSVFFSDEWGCSAALPWLLHPGLATLADTIAER